MTPEQERAIAIARARKRKAEAMNAGEVQDRDTGRELAGGREQAAAISGLINFTQKGNTGRATAAALSAANASTLGALDPIVDGVDRIIPGAPGPSSGSIRAQLREQHPVSSAGGDVAGFLAPGGAIWNLGTSAARIAPQLPGRAAPYIQRLAGLSALGGAENAAFQSTVAASNQAAESGEAVGIPERLEMAKDGATDPFALAAGPVASTMYRGLRGMATGRVTPKNLQPSTNAPALDEIEGMKNEAYQLADSLGVQYTPDSFANMVAKIEQRLVSEGIDPVLHQRATRNLKRIQDRVGDQPLTMQELDKIRQFTRRDVIASGAPGQSDGEKRLGMIVIDEIDDFIESGTGAIGQSGQQGSEAIRRARALNSVWRKSQALSDAVEAAQLRSASTGSGGNFENALRQEIRKIYQNPKKVAGFNEAERAAMKKVIEGDATQNVLRNVGKLSPQGNGLMAALGIGTTAANPWLAPVWIAGMGAKHMAQKGIRNSFDDLDALVRSRADDLPMRNITPPSGPQNALSQGGGPSGGAPAVNALADPQLPPAGGGVQLGTLPQGTNRARDLYEIPTRDGNTVQVGMQRTPGGTYVNMKLADDVARGTGTPGQAKEVFSSAYSALMDDMARNGEDVYKLNGLTPSLDRFYGNQIRRFGVPEGYEALADGSRITFYRIGSPEHTQLRSANLPEEMWVTQTQRTPAR